MKRILLQQVLGVLVEAGRSDLAEEVKHEVKAGLSLTTLPDGKTANAMREELIKELGKPRKASYHYENEWKTPNGGVVKIIKPQDGKPTMIFCERGKIWIQDNFPGIVDV